MATINSPLSKSISPITQPVNSFFRSRLNTINNAVLAALAASAIQGPALKKVNDLIQNMTSHMVVDTAEKGIENTMGDLVTVSLLNEALANLADQAILDDAFDDAALNRATNPMLNDFAKRSLNDFGTNPVPEDNLETPEDSLPSVTPSDQESSTLPGNQRSVAKNSDTAPAANDNREFPEAANDNQESPVASVPTAANDNQEFPDTAEDELANSEEVPPPNLPPEPGSDPRAADSTNPNKNLSPKNQTAGADAPEQTPDEKNSEPAASQPQPEANPEAATKADTAAADTENSEPASVTPTDQESVTSPTTQPEEAESIPETKTPPPLPTEETPPEPTPEVSPSSGTEGVPLVDTDEYGRLKSDSNQPATNQNSNQTNQQPNQSPTAPSSANNSVDPNNPDPSANGAQAAEQNSPDRGKLAQGINYVRNFKKMSELAKQISDLENERKKELKNLKKLNAKLAPLELQRNLLRVSYWSLVAAKWGLRALAALLAITIVFLIFIPIAPAVWFSANIPALAATAVNLKLNAVKEKIAEEGKERDAVKKKIKNLNEKIMALNKDRRKILNQSPLASKQS